MDKLGSAANIIKGARKLLVMTGAGISSSAGIPTFRDRGGLWRNEDISRFGSPEAWLSDPWTCWHAYETFRCKVDGTHPTAAHHFVQRLVEDLGARVITTNVDSLHARAGTEALEIHGALRDLRCMMCGDVTRTRLAEAEEHPSCPRCGNWRRHDVVLWGEAVRHTDETSELLASADVVLLIGMSGVVTGSGEVARSVRTRGGKVIEINPTLITPATWHTTVSLRIKADAAARELSRRMFGG